MSPEAYIGRMRELAIERYRLIEVPGRPEELARVVPDSTAPRLGVSFAYSGGTIRVRPMIDRKWVDEEITDFRIAPDLKDGSFRLAPGWKDRFFRLLDKLFGNPVVIVPPEPLRAADSPIFNHPNTGVPLRTRPIRDNPQA